MKLIRSLPRMARLGRCYQGLVTVASPIRAWRRHADVSKRSGDDAVDTRSQG